MQYIYVLNIIYSSLNACVFKYLNWENDCHWSQICYSCFAIHFRIDNLDRRISPKLFPVLQGGGTECSAHATKAIDRSCQ